MSRQGRARQGKAKYGKEGEIMGRKGPGICLGLGMAREGKEMEGMTRQG
jgi:hypothetical protein